MSQPKYPRLPPDHPDNLEARCPTKALFVAHITTVPGFSPPPLTATHAVFQLQYRLFYFKVLAEAVRQSNNFYGRDRIKELVNLKSYHTRLIGDLRGECRIAGLSEEGNTIWGCAQRLYARDLGVRGFQLRPGLIVRTSRKALRILYRFWKWIFSNGNTAGWIIAAIVLSCWVYRSEILYFLAAITIWLGQHALACFWSVWSLLPPEWRAWLWGNLGHLKDALCDKHCRKRCVLQKDG
jgi:hypothetical protein